MNERHINGSYEQAIIGSLVTDPSQFDAVTSIVTDRDFYDDDLRDLFRLLVDLHELGTPIWDIKLVVDAARKRGLTAGEAEIAEAFTSVPYAKHALYYAQEVLELSRLRRLAQMQQDVNDQLSQSAATSKDIVGLVESRLRTIESSCSLELDDGKEAVRKFEESKASSTTTAMSGLYRLDSAFGGFDGGELIVIGARLGTGKTALAWQITVHNLEQGTPCLFVSLEMKTRHLLERHLSAETSIPSLAIRKNDLTEHQSGQIELEKRKFAEYPISIFAAPSATVRNIKAAARLKRSGGGLGLLVVDYFQLIKSPARAKDDRVGLEQISRELKELALELDVPLIVLAQLNRQADNVIPRSAQLAGSDGIGRDADQVLLLHRKGDTTDLRVDKHRYIQDDAAIDLVFRNGRYTDNRGKPWP